MAFGRSGHRGKQETFAPDHALLSGETVTGGEFVCERCGFELDMERGKVRNLPVCPNCQNDRWRPR